LLRPVETKRNQTPVDEKKETVLLLRIILKILFRKKPNLNIQKTQVPVAGRGSGSVEVVQVKKKKKKKTACSNSTKRQETSIVCIMYACIYMGG
jgi:hypothetical protein